MGLIHLKLTETSSRKVRNAVELAHEETGKLSWFCFDYDTQEAVVFVDDRLVPRSE